MTEGIVQIQTVMGQLIIDSGGVDSIRTNQT